MSKTIDVTGTAVAEHAPAQMAMTPMAMLVQAVDRGASVEVMSKLLDLHERWEKGQSLKVFNQAISEAKREIPPVAKNRKGHNDKRYADFSAYAAVVDPIITKHGLGYRFRTKQGSTIEVTCILFHSDGHSEENSLSGPADTTGSKNAIQAIGSTLSYLQRYTLVQALGLSASDDDDGAAASDAGAITEDQAEILDDLMAQAGADKRAFCQFFRIDGLALLPAKRFAEAERMLRQKIAKRQPAGDA